MASFAQRVRSCVAGRRVERRWPGTCSVRYRYTLVAQPPLHQRIHRLLRTPFAVVGSRRRDQERGARSACVVAAIGAQIPCVYLENCEENSCARSACRSSGGKDPTGSWDTFGPAPFSPPGLLWAWGRTIRKKGGSVVGSLPIDAAPASVGTVLVET